MILVTIEHGNKPMPVAKKLLDYRLKEFLNKAGVKLCFDILAVHKITIERSEEDAQEESSDEV